MAGVLVLAALATGAADAGASQIVYVCEPNLCVVDPETGAASPLTTDGSPELPYRDPSVSADGTRVAASRGDDVLVGALGGNLTERWNGSRGLNDVALSPDGTAVAESHVYIENVPEVRCYPFSGCSLELVLKDRSAASYSQGVAADGTTKQFAGGGGVGFLGDGALLTSFYTLADDAHTVCVIPTPATPADPPCAVEVVETGATLSWPDGSRDGSLIAAAKGPSEGDGPSVINLYDARTGQLVRELATGTTPAFSPDGRELAFQTPDGRIAIVPTAGGPVRTLGAGTMPTWGGGAAPGARIAARTAAYARGRVRLRLRCAGTARCTGGVRIVRRGRTLARGRYAVAAGKAARVAVRATARGRRALAKGRRHRVTVRLTPAGGKPISAKLVVRR